ncbi:pyridoxamine 5'-phosphate oxidase family protein [Dactylosporangium sp. NPDC005572]|uniref:pyridoxamine 5'-phosphate oxidase family protein n=1 Tax=Dactylosporangium sp. NPDC005572 TaxID=3156889 RepID=UPI0033B7349E
MQPDVTMARTILDDNRYVVLGTADEHGTPWVSPVFYTLDGYGELLWISDPQARHSRNIAVRSEVSLVVFDSRVGVGDARAVYLEGRAEELTGAAIDPAASRYNAEAVRKGGQEIGFAELHEGGAFRLYRAEISAHWVLDPGRVPNGRAPVVL